MVPKSEPLAATLSPQFYSRSVVFGVRRPKLEPLTGARNQLSSPESGRVRPGSHEMLF